MDETTNWTLTENGWEYMFITSDGSNDTDSPANRSLFRKHLLFEVLEYLKIIEYQRGYDGHYYDILIKAK